jgi:hypothetical protein
VLISFRFLTMFTLKFITLCCRLVAANMWRSCKVSGCKYVSIFVYYSLIDIYVCCYSCVYLWSYSNYCIMLLFSHDVFIVGYILVSELWGSVLQQLWTMNCSEKCHLVWRNGWWLVIAVNSELIWEESFGLKKWVMACNNLVSEFDHQNDMPSYWWYTGYYMLSFWFMWLCNLLRNCYLCKAQQKQATHSWYTLEALLPKQHFPTVRESSSILVHSKLQVIMVYICKTEQALVVGWKKNMSCNLQVFWTDYCFQTGQVAPWLGTWPVSICTSNQSPS